MADFLGTFNFKSLYKELPAGNVTFELAPAELQNGQVSSRYDLFRNCLAADGTWTMNTRPGTSCYDPEKDGIYIYCKVNDQIKDWPAMAATMILFTATSTTLRSRSPRTWNTGRWFRPAPTRSASPNCS